MKSTTRRIIPLLMGAALALLPMLAGAQSAGPRVAAWRVIASPKNVPHIVEPESLAIDLHGNPRAAKWMYAADDGTHSIIKLGTGGHFFREWHYSGHTKFRAAPGVAVGGSENLFVADSYNAMVRKFSPNGTQLGTWKYANAASAGGGGSTDAVDGQGDVYVASTVTQALQKYSPAGKLLSTIPMPNEGGQGHSQPASVAVAPGGALYVIDACDEAHCTNGRDQNYLVVKMTASGKVLKQWFGGFPHGGTRKGAQPWVVLGNIAVDRAGDWYVTGSNVINGIDRGEVLEYSPAGTLIHQWLTPSFVFGLAVDGQGSIYVTSQNQILKLTRHLISK